MSLKQKTLSGIFWSTGARFVKEILRFAIGVTLARLLTPEAFGLIGMIVVFSGFAGIFRDAGLGAALIQAKELTEAHRSSVFWFNISLGALLTAIFIGIAPFISAFYDTPELYGLTVALAFSFFISAFAIVQRSLLQREMAFRRLAIAEVVTTLIGGTIAITFAVSGFGVWTLVGQTLIGSAVIAITLWIISDWKASFLFQWSALKDLLGFGANLTGFNTFNYWVRNVDDLLVGRFLGSEPLGIYTKAYAIMLFPLQRISHVISKVMFPALSKIQDDKKLTKRVYLRTIAIIGLVTFPLMLGLLVAADHFVLTVLGSQWQEMIILLRILSLVGLCQSIGTTLGWIYTAQGRTDWMFRWGIPKGIVTIIAFIIGLRWGLIGITVAYAIRGFALIYPNYTIPGRLINMSFGDVVRSVSGVFGCAAGMAGLVFSIGYILPASLPHWAYLAVQVPVGVIVYLALIHIFRLQAYQEVRSIIREQIQSGFRNQ